MAEPKICVSLEGISVDEMIDEANRANIAGADYVEVRFDKLYLIKPEPTVTENEDGEKAIKKITGENLSFGCICILN